MKCAKLPLSQFLAVAIAICASASNSALADAMTWVRLETTGDVISSHVFDAHESHRVNTQLSAVIDSLQALGHYYAIAEYQKSALAGETLTVTYAVTTGPVVAVEGLEFPGATRTKSTRLESMLDVHSGETLTPRLLRSVERRLRTQEYIQNAGSPFVTRQEDLSLGRVHVPIRELPLLNVDGALGYAPTGSHGDVVGAAKVRVTNLQGSGRSVELAYSRHDPSRRSALATYSQPVRFFGPGQLEMGVASQENLNESYEFKAHTGLNRRLSDCDFVGVAMAFASRRPAMSGETYHAYSFKIEGARSSTADEIANAGFAFTWSVEYSTRLSSLTAEGRRRFNETRWQIAAHQNWGNSHKGVVAAATVADYTTADRSPNTAELFRLGGPGTLRGYSIEQFSAVRFVTFTLQPEARVENSAGYIFVDAAAIRDLKRSFNPLGYGCGCRLSSGFKTIILELAWGERLTLDDTHVSVRMHSQR